MNLSVVAVISCCLICLLIHIFSSFYSSKKPKRTPVNVLHIPDDNISEDSLDGEEDDSDYQPDNMQLDVEDSDDEMELEIDEADEGEETDVDEEEPLANRRVKKGTKKKKKSEDKVKFCTTDKDSNNFKLGM